MSLKTLETVKQHISDTLGVELVPAHDDRDGGAFNVRIDGNIIRIFISGLFISSIKQSDDMARDLDELDILALSRGNPGRNISINSTGVAVDPVNG